MSQFDLEKAKKGVPMKTRRGNEAIFICVLDGGQPAPLLVDIQRFDAKANMKSSSMENYYLNGRFGLHNHELDLFMNEL